MVEIKNLTKYYGHKAAVKNISFTIEDNEILGFLGPNGAGKSTTLNIISGVIPSTSGTVVINGFDIAQDPIKAKRCIGFLPEIPPVYPDMKVKEYLNFAAGLKGVPSVKRKVQVQRAMERLRITDVSNRLIRNLSKGYRQRVGFAQALINDPPILILDEPTVGLDPTQLIEVRNLILDLKRDHSIILSSHILSEISAVCDRVVVINKGEVQAIDTINNLEESSQANIVLKLKIQGNSRDVTKTASQVEGVIRVSNVTFIKTGIYTYNVEIASKDVRNSLLSALLMKKLEVLEITEEKKSLEQVFVNLINNSGNKKSSLEKLLEEMNSEDSTENNSEKNTNSDSKPDDKNKADKEEEQ
ncbi:MAG: ABC transporter ATP-binding protein [Ruminococcus sp.]|nr:ABC transporter ATP-binding protein [Ruminococcus sp.]